MFKIRIMKKNIFYNILCCLLTLCITGCTDNEGQQKATLVAIRPAIGTTGTEVTLYGEGFHPVASKYHTSVWRNSRSNGGKSE